MKTNYSFFLALLFLFNIGLYAQNNNCGTPTPNDFVINGGFEQVSSIPNSLGQLTRACNWLDNANIATPDFFHRNSQEVDVSLPQNTRGPQTVNPIHGGDAYAGFAVQPRVFNNNPVVYTEIIGTQLTSSLQPGTQYDLSFDISRAENMGANPIRVQAYLGSQFTLNTEHELPNPNGLLLQNATFSNNTTGWDTVTFRFTASAGQNFLYLGGISNTIFQNPNAGGFLPTYYYIDNVSLVVASDCNNESINITTELPDCNIFENSNTFEICGTFTTNSMSTYNLSLNITDTDSSPWPTNSPITNISNVTTTNGVTSGNFCVTLNESNFNVNNNYQIDTQINSQVNGQTCRVNSNTLLLPFNDCDSDTECPDCNKDILENISIVETKKDCKTFQISVPKLFDCYKVAYSINNGPQETLPEGISTITFEDNGSYMVKFGVFDLETDKACAKKAFKIEVDCEPMPVACNWLKSIGTVNGDWREEQGTSVVVDSNNDIILLGRSLPNTNIEGTVISGTTYLSKYSPEGCFISATDMSFLGVPVDMEITSNDELLILTKNNYGVNGANNNYYLHKINSSGNLIWSNTYSYSQGSGSSVDDVKMHFKKSTEEVFLLTTINSTINITDSTNNIITIQNIPNTFSVIKGSIIKISPNGIIDWSQTVYSRIGGIRSYSIAVSENTDELFLLGAGPGGYNIPHFNEIIFKNNNTGSENIVTTIPSNNATPNKIDFIAKINANNGAYNSINFFPDWGFSYVAKLAYNHNTNSLFVIPGIFTTNAQVLNSNLIIQNSFQDSRFTKSVMVNGDYLYTTGGSGGRFFVAKMNSSGTIWIKKSSNQYYSVSNNIAINGDKIYTTGYFKDSNINLGSGNQIDLIGGYDAFLTRLTDNGSSAVFSRNIDESLNTDSEINVFPNPAKNKVTVSVENTKINSIELYNIYGKPVQTIKNINTLKQELDVNRLSRGYYVLKITLHDGTIQHFKISFI